MELRLHNRPYSWEHCTEDAFIALRWAKVSFFAFACNPPQRAGLSFQGFPNRRQTSTNAPTIHVKSIENVAIENPLVFACRCSAGTLSVRGRRRWSKRSRKQGDEYEAEQKKQHQCKNDNDNWSRVRLQLGIKIEAPVSSKFWHKTPLAKTKGT